VKPSADCACNNCEYKLRIKGQFLWGIRAGVGSLSYIANENSPRRL